MLCEYHPWTLSFVFFFALVPQTTPPPPTPTHTTTTAAPPNPPRSSHTRPSYSKRQQHSREKGPVTCHCVPIENRYRSFFRFNPRNVSSAFPTIESLPRLVSSLTTHYTRKTAGSGKPDVTCQPSAANSDSEARCEADASRADVINHCQGREQLPAR